MAWQEETDIAGIIMVREVPVNGQSWGPMRSKCERQKRGMRIKQELKSREGVEFEEG